MSKLETTHWYHADSTGLGILQLKDWRGTTLPGESTAVPNTETRLVRKDLARWSGGTKTVVTHNFYNARPGGWTHVCRTPPKTCGTGGCAGDRYSSDEIYDQAPQIPRETGCKLAGGDCDQSVYDFPQDLRSVEQKCWTASPFPQCKTCEATDSCNGECDVCDDSCAGCGEQTLTKCGGESAFVCAQDQWEANCNSIHFTFHIYYDNNTGNDDNERCVRVNHAWLFAINENCAADDGACSASDCPPGPVTETPNRALHYISLLTTKKRLCDQIDSTYFCKGARQLLGDGSTWQCPGTLVKQPDANDPDRFPGTSQKGPYDSRGCGVYLCNDGRNDPLGACCVDDGTTVTCLDAVTEKQCTECGEQTGYSSVWHGANSCCGTNDDLCEP